MQYRHLHKWNVSARKAIQIQCAWAEQIIPFPKRLKDIKRIAGVDVSFRRDQCLACVCVFTYPQLSLIEQRITVAKVTFPYIPTLLTFREGPAILKSFKKIKHKPRVILFDGQGIAHPRKMGLASHLGLWLKLPTIGCAKTPLYGEFKMPARTRGAFSLIMAKKVPIGAALRTKDNTKPIFVSPGYQVSLKQAIEISLNCCPRYRIPEPLRVAHTLSKTWQI